MTVRCAGRGAAAAAARLVCVRLATAAGRGGAAHHTVQVMLTVEASARQHTSWFT